MEALKPKPTPQPYDSQATVTRVEDDTLWVHIPGGVDETPVKKTIAASVGDEVQVRVSGGRAWVTGNASAPPTDDAAANAAGSLAAEALDEIVQINKLKVGWADIQEAIVQYLKLYGLMTVYEDDITAAIGGHIGYGSGPSDIGNGVALISREPTDTWSEAPVIEGTSVILIGEKGLFFGLHYWGNEIPLWIDGGIDVNQNNFRQWFKLLPSGLVTNCDVSVGGDLEVTGDAEIGGETLYGNNSRNWVYPSELGALAQNVFYSSGDTLAHGSLVPYAGLITTSATMVIFSVPLPKSMANVDVAVDSLIGGIRGVSGYVDGTTDSTDLLSMGYTVSATKSDDRTVRIILTKTSAFTNAANNTPVTVYAKVGLSFA